MLDGRVYRTAFLPALVALFVAAFALQDRPEPARSALSADAFDGARAFDSLQDMAAAFPQRGAGAVGDDALADLVARELAAPDEPGARPAFTVRSSFARARGGDLRTLVATRPGILDRRIVVVAERDAPGAAGLSATAALLELGRVFKTRELEKTLVLVSTSGATTGHAGTRAWAQGEDAAAVDGVIVLGDVAGTRIRKPWVVSWPSSSRPVPLALERTVQSALRRETSSDAGGPRAIGQWFRRALPVTVSAQGPIGAEGLPAVLISESGERGPAAGEPVLEERLEAFGRAAVHAVGALDTAGPRTGPAFADAPEGIVTMRNVLPDWAARLVVGSALLPALLAALDAFFRARRRRIALGPWLAWLAVAALPLPVAWLWLRLLGATGAIDTPDGPVLGDRFPAGTSGIVALTSAALAAALVWWTARLLVGAWGRRASGRRTRAERPRRAGGEQAATSAGANDLTPPEDGPAPAPGGEPVVPPARFAEPAPGGNGRAARRAGAGVDGLAVATAVWVCALAAVAWLLNPYAAGLLVPAVHLWLFAAAGGWGLRAGLIAIVAGLAAPVLAFVHLGLALGLAPHELAWGAALGAAAGAGLWSSLLLGGLLAALAGLVRVLLARRRIVREGDGATAPILTRGPVTYAGPGSLGGTESALRR